MRKIKNIHAELLAWYKKNSRKLPWRKSTDPYRVWLSEIMLQQTRVETVIPYYERFLSHFPTVYDLAEADIQKVQNLWAGLGYYSRARNLSFAAKQVVNDFGGVFPSRLEDLRTLKGIGPYTAAAIASICFGQNIPAIDGNLERVFARLLGTKLNPKTEGKSTVLAMGEQLTSLGKAGDINQALMDLSATTCLPKIPKCQACPIQNNCQAKALGIQSEIPTRSKKTPIVELEAEGLILLSGGEILLAKRPKGQWLTGMWDIPWWIGKKTLPKWQRTDLGGTYPIRPITHHKIHFSVNAWNLKRKPTLKQLNRLPAPVDEYLWIAIENLEGYNLPRPSEKALATLLSTKYPEL